MANSVYTNDNPVFAAFAFYVSALILKMCYLQVNTIFQRITKKIFSNEEDVKLNDPTGKLKLVTVLNNPDVERTRRAHLNDIENIVPFIFLGIFYISTQPAHSTALLVFRIFTAARFLHSIFYLGQVRQPFRGLTFGVAFAVNVFMAVCIILFYK